MTFFLRHKLLMVSVRPGPCKFNRNRPAVAITVAANKLPRATPLAAFGTTEQ